MEYKAAAGSSEPGPWNSARGQRVGSRAFNSVRNGVVELETGDTDLE